MLVLETRGLGKDYGSTRAVSDLDLRVDAGEIFGLLGPNGAGKTTAISMICGVTTPTRGTVEVAGISLKNDRFAARRAIGLVPQDMALYEPLDAIQNLRFFGSLYGISGRELDTRIDWALSVAGLRDRARDQVSHYSGGMKRRLNLAAGLLHKPKILILDEPTVGVDPQSRNHIFECIQSLVADDNITVVYTSHYMEEVELLCRRVAIMDSGTVIAADEVEALVRKHGNKTVEVEYRGARDLVHSALAEIGELVAHENHKAPKDPKEVGAASQKVTFVGAVKPGVVVRAVESVGGEVDSLATRGGNLEQVFLALTGHSLRDET